MLHQRAISGQAQIHSSLAHNLFNPVNNSSNMEAMINPNISNIKVKVMAILNMAHREAMDSTHNKEATHLYMVRVATMLHTVCWNALETHIIQTDFVQKANNIPDMHNSHKRQMHQRDNRCKYLPLQSGLPMDQWAQLPPEP
jgi:hypothetical protein